MDSFWNATLSVFRGGPPTPGGSGTDNVNPVKGPNPSNNPGYFLSRQSTAINGAASHIETLPVPIPQHVTMTSMHLHSDILYVGLSNGSILAYVVPNQTHTHTFTHPEMSSAVTVLGSTARRLLAGYADGSAVIYSLSTGLATRTVAAAHIGPITALAIAADSGNEHAPHLPTSVFTGGVDGVLNEWDAKTLRKKWMLNGHDTAISGVACGSGRVYSSDAHGCVKGWDTTTGQCVADFGGMAPVTALILGRDLLYIATDVGTISVVDTDSGQTLRTLTSRHAAASPPPSPIPPSQQEGSSLSRHSGALPTAIHSLCLAKGRLYSATPDGCIQEWDVKKGRAARRFTVPSPPCIALCADAPDGRIVVGCAGSVNLIRVAATTHNNNASHSPLASPAASQYTAPQPSPVAAALSLPQDNDILRPTDSISNSGPADELPDDVVALKRQIAQLRAQINNNGGAAWHHHQTHTHHELQTRAEDAEEELQAAKDLLAEYKEELEITQQAHAYAFSYLSASSNRTWFEIEKEIRGLQAMIDNPPIPLTTGPLEDLTGFLPRRKAARCWTLDDDWDSDVEVDDLFDEAPWWRNVDGIANRTNPSDIKWWRGEMADLQPGDGTVEPETDEDRSAYDEPTEDEHEDDGTEGEEDQGEDEEHGFLPHPEPSTPPPKIHVRATQRLPDGSILTNAAVPAPIPRRITVPAATAIAAARSLATSPSNSHAALAPYSSSHTTRPQRPAQPAKRLSSWLAPIQSWVETVVAGADPYPPPPPSQPRPLTSATSSLTTPPQKHTSRSSTTGSESTSATAAVAKVRVRQADVWRFDNVDAEGPPPVA
ncbi:quinon protein alcohol dehydrogenase-like superfamily [Powellomyces hirtus]|nr:quinon protein alcohol dehydrogenase-like superfamily [Powellomyces hirtus]